MRPMLRCRPQLGPNGLMRATHPIHLDSIFNRVRHKPMTIDGKVDSSLMRGFQPVVQLHLRRKTMKKLQQLFASVVLTLLLSVSAFAGDGVIIAWVTAPPQPPVTTNNAAATEGIMWPMLTSNDSATEVSLSLLQGVLALF